MSLELSGGINVSTHAGWAATKDGPFHALWLFGGDRHVEVGMSTAVTAIQEVINDPARTDNRTMQSLQKYVRSLHVESNDRESEWIVPDSLGQQALQGALASAEDQTYLEFLGNNIAETDFVHLVDYVMTNTSVWLEMPTDTEDPHVATIQAMRSGN
ncbi:MAG TPA: hypothetical protein VK712_01010 [Verrucomicrobiae bacterium]|jgi:hypothetical protein|nr:hypothetical protein [Verrucomicrobiae bacterium]